MSELNQIGCAEFADVAAELALGVLTGRERAQALAHLDRCDACRQTVRELTVTGEELVGLRRCGTHRTPAGRSRATGSRKCRRIRTVIWSPASCATSWGRISQLSRNLLQ